MNDVHVSFLYDDQGLRTQTIPLSTDTYILLYLYDESASPIGFQYKTELTKAGKRPSWTTVRQRYWKNEDMQHTEPRVLGNEDIEAWRRIEI